MKKVEIEFSDLLRIGVIDEIIIFNVKMNKTLNDDEYDIKITATCDNKNRKNTYKITDIINWDKDYRDVVNEWLKKNNVCNMLKEKLKIKLEESFEYKYIL